MAAVTQPLGLLGAISTKELIMESITFWLNAFIPNSVCEQRGNVFALTAPGNRFFAGDQREFSDDPLASARMHSEVTIQGLTSSQPQITGQKQICGESREVDANGKVIASATAETNRMRFLNLRGSQTTDPEGGVVDGVPGSIQIDFEGSASLPLLALAPDIDYSGTLTIDLSEGNVLVKGAISGFPAFEAYFSSDAGPAIPLGQFSPGSPFDLVGPENRPISVSARVIG